MRPALTTMAPPAADLPGGRPSPDAWLIFALFGLVAWLPPAIYFVVGTSSHAVGLAIACVIFLVPAGLRLRVDADPSWLAAALLFVVFHLFVATYFHEVDVQRAGLSVLLLAMVFVTAFYMGAWLFTRSSPAMNRAVSMFRLAMVFIGLLPILGFQVASARFEKAIFPFTEPSHYALTFTPLLVHACVVSKEWRRYCWLTVGLALGYGLENLTLLVGVALAAAVSLPISRLVAGILALAAAIGAMQALDISYFSDRLDLSTRSENLSVLIYLQGWELSLDGLSRTSGWGIGLQQLGFVQFRSLTADTIFRLYRNDFNLPDGGFLFAKLVSEFGVFGLALVGAYTFLAIRSALLLRKVAMRKLAVPGSELFATCIIYGFAVDMFVRGLAYFAASALLFISAISYSRMARQWPRRHPAIPAHVGA